MNTFSTWDQMIEARYRYDKYLHEAEMERMVRLARLNKPGSDPLQARLLLWFGRHMVAWGAHLVERFEAERFNSNKLVSDPVQPSTACG